VPCNTVSGRGCSHTFLVCLFRRVFHRPTSIAVDSLMLAATLVTQSAPTHNAPGKILEFLAAQGRCLTAAASLEPSQRRFDRYAQYTSTLARAQRQINPLSRAVAAP